MLEGGFTQTGGFRASVMKLMVSPKHRRKWVAKELRLTVAADLHSGE